VGISALVSMVIIAMITMQYNAMVIPIANGRYLQTSLLYLLLFVIVIAGLVGSSRMYLQKHELNELFGGYLVGLLSPFLALQVMMIIGKITFPLSVL
jgi:hypothetical protein